MKLLPPLLVALVLAGCTGSERASLTSTPPIDPVTAVEENVPEAENVTEPVLWEATMRQLVTVCPKDGPACASTVPATGRTEPYRIQLRNLTHASLTLSWSPTSSWNEKLGFAIFSCEVDCPEWHLLAYAEGTSPLTLDTPLAPLAPDEEAVYLHVWAVNQTPSGPADTYIRTTQPIRAEGVVHGVRA